MGTGASAAKRNAKRQAADAYYKALRESKRAERMDRIDTQGRRKISDQLGNDMSARSKSLARKADRVGRDLNANQEDFNTNIDRYNKRWDALQEQFKGTNVGKYNGDSSELVGKKNGEFARIDAEIERLRQEEADYVKGKPNPPRFGMASAPAALDDVQRERAQKIQDLQEERGFVERTSKWVGNSYRHLGNLEDAFNELSTLSKGAQGYVTKPNDGQPSQEQLQSLLSPKINTAQTGGINITSQNDPTQSQFANINTGAKQKQFDPENMQLDPNAAGSLVKQFASQYQAIGDKLKQSLARDQRMASPKQKPGGLLSSEIMDGSGQIDKEVIG